MSEQNGKLEVLLGQLDREEQALAELREAHNRNGHGSRTALRLIIIKYRADAITRLRLQITALDPRHTTLSRPPASLPVLDELVDEYERLERELPWYEWRVGCGRHPQHLPGLQEAQARTIAAFDAVWHDLNTRFADHPRVKQLAASRSRPFG